MHESIRHPVNTITKVCTAIGLATIGAGGLYIGDKLDHGHLFNVTVNVPVEALKTPPATIEAAVQPQTITLSETDITMTCSGNITMGVATAGKDGRNWIDSAVVNKEWFPSADPCGDNNVVNADAVIKGFVSHGHKVITEVTAVVPPIVPEMTGINMADVKNCCIDVKKGESEKQIQEDIDNFELAKYQNKEPNDATGFRFTSFLGHNNTPDIIIYSQELAQVAFELYPGTDPDLAKQARNIDRAFDYELKGMYPGANVTIVQRPQPLSEAAQIEAREQEFLPEAAQSINSLKFEEIKEGHNEDQLQLELTGPNHAQMIIGFPGPDTMTPFQINSLNKLTGGLLDRYEWKPPASNKPKH
jgi:hypothetical protein